MPESNLDRWAREVEDQSRGSIWKGLGLTLLFNVLAGAVLLFALATVLANEWVVYLMMYMGLTQLIYMIPAILSCRRRGANETAKGMIIGVSITFLLNAACSGLL